MPHSIRFYRYYYGKLAGILLGMSVFMLLLAGACMVIILIRKEPDCYATHVNGWLIPLEPVKVVGN